MKAFENAKWIWTEENSLPDSYGEFYKAFEWQGGKAVCRISCDGDYTLFVNGFFVSSNQYGDYEWYKSYDSVDITRYLKKGKNALAVLVWHFGENSQRYVKASAGLIFEVEEGGQVCVESDETTLSRYSPTYQNGRKKPITVQLGYGFGYDATKEDDWTDGNAEGFHSSVCVKKACTFVPRPTERAKLLPPAVGKIIEEKEGKFYTVDLGEEFVGLLSFSLTASAGQKILVAYGEDLQDGKVRRLIGNRDFSVDYVAKRGLNEYVNYMLRLGCRYLQIESEEPFKLHYASLIPQTYPVKVKPFKGKNLQAEAVYQICLNSLRLCMMEHYVDCPWREQCLYAFDSRNQMLCGYYAFEDGNFEYAKANLLLMSQDRREDGLMSICYPCGVDMTIPSFSLYYTLSVKEYIEYSGDKGFAKAVYPRICEYMNAFLANCKDGLVYRFQDKRHWNFYDWTNHLHGQLLDEERLLPDAMINVLTVTALRCFKEICEAGGLEYPYGDMDEAIAKKTLEAFYKREKGLFSLTENGGEFVENVNALAVAFGLVSGKEAEYICEKLASGELEESSLSMRCFKYDALLKTDEAKYRETVLSAIYADYGKMVESGSTATWETIDGASAFGNAGSLCHGWSAIPIYYLRKLKEVE